MTRRKFGLALSGLFLPASLAKAQPPKAPRIIDGRVIIGDFNKAIGENAVVDGPSHDGVEITVDLPSDQHVKNFGAPDDNLGLCVFASMTHGARWHNVRELEDVIHKLRKGGGWPEKVDQVFKQYAPKLKYVQHEGANPSILDKAMAESRMCHVTYGYGERYRMQTIAHMVNLVHLDQKWAVVLDNNFPGTYEWMSRAEFLKRWVHPNGQGWAYIMLAPPAPPVPHN